MIRKKRLSRIFLPSWPCPPDPLGGCHFLRGLCFWDTICSYVDPHTLPCDACYRGIIEIYDGLEGDSHKEICPDCGGTREIVVDALECNCDECKRAYFVIVDNIYEARFVDQGEAISYAIKLNKNCVVERGSGEPVFEMRITDKNITNFLRCGNAHMQPFTTD